MKTTSKILGLTTAAVAILSAPAMAETVKVQVGEKVTYETKNVALPGDNVVGFEIEERQEFARLDENADGVVSRKEFYKKTMLENEAEIFALFDSNQSGEITPEEFSNNSRYGNGQLTNKTTNKTRQYSNTNFGSMREKFYAPEEYDVIEPASGDQKATIKQEIEAGIDYNGIDNEPNVNQGIDYKGEPKTPGAVDSNIVYEGKTKANYN